MHNSHTEDTAIVLPRHVSTFVAAAQLAEAQLRVRDCKTFTEPLYDGCVARQLASGKRAAALAAAAAHFKPYCRILFISFAVMQHSHSHSRRHRQADFALSETARTISTRRAGTLYHLQLGLLEWASLD